MSGTKLYFTTEEISKIKILLLKPVKKEHRAKIWMIASGAMREKCNNPQYYTTLRDFPEGIPSPYETQIEMDLHRTFPQDPFFKKKTTIDSMKNILLAYSRRNISIGYCQGFNFIVGRILTIVNSEEDAFWLFVVIIESILPLNYYSELAGIIIDTSILHWLFKAYNEEVYAHLTKLNYQYSINNLLYKWFVSLFIQNTSEECSLIIWDCLFLDGDIALFYASIAMFTMMEVEIITTTAMENLHYLFDEEISKYNKKEIVQHYCLIKSKDVHITREFLLENRAIYEKEVVSNILQGNSKRLEMLMNTKRQASYVKGMVICQRDWPMCIYDLAYKYNNILNCLVLKTGEKLNVIENYFFKECFKKPYIRSKSIEKENEEHHSFLEGEEDNSNNKKRKRPTQIYILPYKKDECDSPEITESVENSNKFDFNSKFNDKEIQKKLAMLNRERKDKSFSTKEDYELEVNSNNKEKCKEVINRNETTTTQTTDTSNSQFLHVNQPANSSMLLDEKPKSYTVYKKCASKSPKKIVWNKSNKEAMKFKAYLNLLIERRKHICEEQEDDDESSIIEKIQREETIRKRAVTLVSNVKQFISNKPQKDVFFNVASKVQQSTVINKKEEMIVQSLRGDCKSFLNKEKEFELDDVKDTDIYFDSHCKLNSFNTTKKNKTENFSENKTKNNNKTKTKITKINYQIPNMETMKEEDEIFTSNNN